MRQFGHATAALLRRSIQDSAFEAVQASQWFRGDSFKPMTSKRFSQAALRPSPSTPPRLVGTEADYSGSNIDSRVTHKIKRATHTEEHRGKTDTLRWLRVRDKRRVACVVRCLAQPPSEALKSEPVRNSLGLAGNTGSTEEDLT